MVVESRGWAGAPQLGDLGWKHVSLGDVLMLLQGLFVYCLVGAVVSFVTMRVFPPMEGFQPTLSLRLVAAMVFAFLWPVLVLLAVWYLSVGYLNRNYVTRNSIHESKVAIDLRNGYGQVPISKPR